MKSGNMVDPKVYFDNVCFSKLLSESEYHIFNRRMYDLTGEQFGSLYGDVTGEELFREYNDNLKQVSKDRIRWRNWEISNKKTKCTISGNYSYELKIKGCPAKNVFGGRNYDTITLFDCQQEMKLLSEHLGITISDFIIRPKTEISVTLFPEQDLQIRGRLIQYQNEAFLEDFNTKTKEFMGVVAPNAHYEVKLYFVNVKYPELERVVLRMERSIKKMFSYKRQTGIQTLGDLLTIEAAETNLNLLIDTLEDFIIYDPSLKPNRKLFSKRIIECIISGGDPKFWKSKKASMDRKTYWKLVDDYREVSNKYGEGLFHRLKDILQLHKEELSKAKIPDCDESLRGHNQDIITVIEEEDLIEESIMKNKLLMVTGNINQYNMEEINITTGTSIDDLRNQYREICDWFVAYNSLKRQWVNELGKINQAQGKGEPISTDRWVSIDIQLEMDKICFQKKQQKKLELAEKITGMESAKRQAA